MDILAIIIHGVRMLRCEFWLSATEFRNEMLVKRNSIRAEAATETKRAPLVASSLSVPECCQRNGQECG